MASKSKTVANQSKNPTASGSTLREWIAAHRPELAESKPSEKLREALEESLKALAARNTEWMEHFGRPMPQTGGEWQAEATRAGMPYADVQGGSLGTILPFIEGHLQRLQDEHEIANLRLSATAASDSGASVSADLQAGVVLVNGVKNPASATTCKIVDCLVSAKGGDVKWEDIETDAGLRGKNRSREMDAVRRIVGALLHSSRNGYRIVS